MPDSRSAYLADSVATVSPARLLTMLYDRLLLDLDRAHDALLADDRPAAGRHLGHAQDIVTELISSLDVGAWDGGPRLLSVYTYLLSQLFRVGSTGDVQLLAACRGLVGPLAEAWHEAAAIVSDATARNRSQALAQSADEVGSSVLGVA